MFRFYYCRRTNRSYDRPFYYSQICRNYPHSRSYIAVRRHHILGNRTWKPVLSFSLEYPVRHPVSDSVRALFSTCQNLFYLYSHIHLLFPESILPVHASEPLRLFMFLYYVFNMYQKLNTILEKIYFSCYDLNNTKQITPYIYTPTI